MKKNIIHVRSKDGLQLTNGYNTNFTINLKQPIECLNDEEIHVKVISAEIPFTFYCISQYLNNNRFDYDNTFYNLPDKNYDIEELLRELNDNTPFTVSHNEYTNKLTFTNEDTINHKINIEFCTCAKALGLQLDGAVYTILPNNSLTTKGIVDLATVHSLLIRSDLASGNVQSSNNGNSTILQKVSVDVNPYDIIYLTDNDYRTTSVIKKNIIDTITFLIIDQNNTLVNLNDINFEFSLEISIVKNEVLNTRRIEQAIQPLPIQQVQTPQVSNKEVDEPQEEENPVYATQESLLDLLLED